MFNSIVPRKIEIHLEINKVFIWNFAQYNNVYVWSCNWTETDLKKDLFSWRMDVLIRVHSSIISLWTYIHYMHLWGQKTQDYEEPSLSGESKTRRHQMWSSGKLVCYKGRGFESSSLSVKEHCFGMHEWALCKFPEHFLVNIGLCPLE